MTLAPGIVLPVVEVAEICRRYRVKELSVFGSAARGDLRPDSDIDLLVEFQPGSPVGLFELWDLNDELERLLERRVDLVTKGGIRELMRGEVLREARPVYAA
ncbi:MAG: nucleotidyltransferase family protein [Acidobacteriota bacterium]